MDAAWSMVGDAGAIGRGRRRDDGIVGSATLLKVVGGVSCMSWISDHCCWGRRIAGRPTGGPIEVGHEPPKDGILVSFVFQPGPP